MRSFDRIGGPVAVDHPCGDRLVAAEVLRIAGVRAGGELHVAAGGRARRGVHADVRSVLQPAFSHGDGLAAVEVDVGFPAQARACVAADLGRSGDGYRVGAVGAVHSSAVGRRVAGYLSAGHHEAVGSRVVKVYRPVQGAAGRAASCYLPAGHREHRSARHVNRVAFPVGGVAAADGPALHVELGVAS